LIDLSPARQQLLANALDIQDRMLNGCELIFRGLSGHHDPEVSSVSGEALRLITYNRDVLEAMIDALNATLH
jgi:hypothetical protein